MSNCRRIQVNNVVLDPGTSLTIVVPEQTFVDYCTYEVCCEVDLTTATGTEGIVVNNGTDNLPLENCINANLWRVNQLQCFADCCGCRFTKLFFRMVYGSTGGLSGAEGHFDVKYPVPNRCGRFTPAATA